LSADDLGTKDIDAYSDKRQKAGAKNATINRELAALKRMYQIARAADLPQVQKIPVIPRLKENAPRQGFIEDADYNLLGQYTTELWLRALLAVGYTYGFREAELLSLKVGQVHPSERTIRLNAGETKNDEGRTVSMTTEVYQLLSALVAGKVASDFVFTRADRSPVRDFRGAWFGLCKRAGLGKFEKGEDGKEQWQGLLFHDLRRSAVRNMVRSGVPERVAMAISGHKTRSVFDRYNIVNDADLRMAAVQIERAREARATKLTATTTATTPEAAKIGGHGIADKLQYLQ
jgi:integrase